MVDKVSVNPLSVRGAGDIVSPKTASDFDVYNSTIVSSSEDVDGAVMTVYTVSYVNGTYFKISSDNIISVDATSFTVSAVLRQSSDDSAVSGATVTCLINNETELTGTTDTGGNVSFTFDMVEDVGKYIVKLTYKGSGGIGGAFKVTGLICVDLTSLTLGLTGDKTIIQTGDDLTLTATLTGTDSTGATIGLPHQKVYFTRDNQTSIGYENEGTDLSTLTIGSGASVTVEDGALKITTSTTGEKNIAYNYDLNNSDNFLFECEVAKLGTYQSVAMYVKNSTTATGCWFNYENSSNYWGGGCTGSTFNNVDTGVLKAGDIIRITYKNQVITLYHNDNVIYSKESVDLGEGFRVGHYTNQNRIQYIKNVRFLPLGFVGDDVTDANGNATTVYHGTGAGEVNIIAFNNEYTLSSRILSMWDTLKYDTAISSDYNDIWAKRATSDTFERLNEYSSLIGQIYTSFTPSGDFAIDYDVYIDNGKGNWFWYCVQNGNFGGCSLNNLGLTDKEWHKIHMEFTEGLITISSNHSETVITQTVSYNQNAGMQFRFNVNGSIEEIRFRNFKIYYLGLKPSILISLTGDKTIISTDEEVTLTAEVSNISGEKLANKTVTVIEDGLQIGTAITNSQGVATLSVIGTGQGDREFMVSTYDQVAGRSISSEIYEVLDCKWYDFGTDSTNNIWLNSSTMTVNYGDDCATLTETTSGTTGVRVTDSNHQIQPNDVFEFDFMQVDGSRVYAPIYIRNKTNGVSLSNFHLSHINQQINTWIHLKCQIIDTILYIYVNDNPTPVERPMSNTDTDYRLYLNTPTDITTLKYKNFKVYSG